MVHWRVRLLRDALEELVARVHEEWVAPSAAVNAALLNATIALLMTEPEPPSAPKPMVRQ